MEHSLAEKRTGIEGWFDEPATRDVKDLRQPPRRRPVEADDRDLPGVLPAEPGRELGRGTHGGWLLPLRVLASVMAMTPIMTYLALPWITKQMEWFLQPKRP